MNNVLDSFHPAVAAWFARTFDAPTEAQTKAWPAFSAGEHVLVAAPTGSGKTFAAFLAAIDNLVKEGLSAPLPAETRIVYVSPLKALSNDIKRNLAAPLAGDPGRIALARLAGRRYSRGSQDRRHQPGCQGRYGAGASAHSGDHAGITLYFARFGVGQKDAVGLPHGDRR